MHSPRLFHMRNHQFLFHVEINGIHCNHVMILLNLVNFSMLSRCKDCVNGKVNYIEFLENIKVDVRPGDLIGLSHQITNGCDQRENDRLGEQVVR